MPWWPLLYVVVYAGIGLAAAIDDYRSGKGVSWALGELLATAVASAFVVALWREDLRLALGRAVVPLFVGALIWEVVSARDDLSSLERDASLSTDADRTANRLGVLLGIMLVAPALVSGAVLSWRAMVSSAA